MLKFYYNPLSPNVRRVWLMLLEKEIPFEPVLMKLDGDQLQPEFLAINPFHHIPVVVDDGLRIVESLAILDYLEAKYPTPTMLPTEPAALAKVRMVQLVTANELFPQVIPLICEADDSSQVAKAKDEIRRVLEFFAATMGNSLYFGDQQLTLADITAGVAMSVLVKLDASLSDYPEIQAWYERLMQREAWQKTEPDAEGFAQFKRRVQVLVKLRKRELLQGKR